MESRQAVAIAREILSLPPAPRRRATVGGVLRLILVWTLALHLCYLLATAILIAAYRHVDPPATVLMASRKWFFGWDLQAPRPVSLRKVPRHIRSMLIAVEDGKFYEHHGVDLDAIRHAREINKRLGKPLYGGSTLTMQVARTLFLVPEKSYVRKYLEVLTAFELEALLPKDRILELYFGYAEWGRGIFGIDAAARRWYGRGVSALTRDEAARLVALLSSPVKYGPDTLQRNGILRERYRYLSARFGQAARTADAPASGGATAVPGAVPGAAAAADVSANASGPPAAADRPPPSPEPGTDPDAEPAAAGEPALTPSP
jgi:monofunctional biosynthetic peptidoglycan transglycosylase